MAHRHPAPGPGDTQASSGVDQPSHVLMLTKDLFQLAFHPRNLYYLNPAGQGLVPDPVFVPVNSEDPAADLVRALLISPQGWLKGAVLSAFPPAATPGRPVEILPGSKTAVVDLRLPKSATSATALGQMASQLVWTLTSSSYGSASIQAVKLEINGKVWTPPGVGSAVLTRGTYPQPALEPPQRENLYFLASSGAARLLRGHDGSSSPVPGQAGTGRSRCPAWPCPRISATWPASGSRPRRSTRVPCSRRRSRAPVRQRGPCRPG